MSMSLICPKCGSSMRSYERNGVNVDQCEGCRGVFLDFGELEAIVRAAQPEPGSPATQAPQTFQQPPPQAYAPPAYPQQPYPPAGYQPGWGHHPHKRRGGIASLFFSS